VRLLFRRADERKEEDDDVRDAAARGLARKRIKWIYEVAVMLVVRGIGGRSSEGEEFRSARGVKVEDDELTERQGNDLIRCIY
jgi:hypothetical protein